MSFYDLSLSGCLNVIFYVHIAGSTLTPAKTWSSATAMKENEGPNSVTTSETSSATEKP